ncbi:Methyltransferase type 11 [Alkalidesulfovibrio alkalitolerans DSM 16529]|jgi:demethylmenaquinone methyltransferase/2-methoxy-6-polyprenyl-1,4-benzoquinol methylase|uniref:Methyltransferase type 11 n=1 Tax=Alkalidesulfovibrio alkalitolerans DSM 16529 TaxID=1121439 RepID=S7THJ3_9BACT|nr:class I SAM-dependent methyltransferase [Alkalidesulfovibrio alkalitolerans]EPR36281.1 Methyltransferase type 11 [Alkalidesulfovibrio alkalitolerans DSM 16529]
MDHYRAIAPIYEPLLGPPLAPLRRAAARLLSDHGARRVLDCCAGTGGQMRFMARAGLVPFGLDRSRAMLARAPQSLPRVLAQAQAMPFAADTFDAACITLALHEMPRPTALAVLKDIARVVAAHGLVLAADYAAPLPRLMRPAVHLAERIAGRDHYQGFTAYQRLGGLPPLAREAGLMATPLDGFLGGSLVLWRLDATA